MPSFDTPAQLYDDAPMTETCRDCPESFFLDHTIETKHREERAVEQVQQALGQCTLKDTFSGQRRRLEHKLTLSRAMLNRCERLLPENGEAAIAQCPAPFERIIELEESDSDTAVTRERICGARV